MPTYDYVCDACQHSFEHFQTMSDKLLRKCPECGKNRLRRLIGAGAGLIFKGSGFYITDYRGDNYQKDASKDSAPSSSTEKSSSTTDSSSSDTKPAPADSSSSGSGSDSGSGSGSSSGKGGKAAASSPASEKKSAARKNKDA